MKRTTIMLPDILDELVRYEAERRGTSVSDVIRDSIAYALVETAPRELPFAGLCDDPQMIPAARMEEELEGWGDDVDRDRG